MNQKNSDEEGSNQAKERKSRLVEYKRPEDFRAPDFRVTDFPRWRGPVYWYSPMIAVLIIVTVSLFLFKFSQERSARVVPADRPGETPAAGATPTGKTSTLSDEEAERATVLGNRSPSPLRQEFLMENRGWSLEPVSGMRCFPGELLLGERRTPVALFQSGRKVVMRVGEGEDAVYIGEDDGVSLRWRESEDGGLAVEKVNNLELALVQAIVRTKCPFKEALSHQSCRILRVERDSFGNLRKVTVHFQSKDGMEDVDVLDESLQTVRWRIRHFPDGELSVFYSDISEVGGSTFPLHAEVRHGSVPMAEVVFSSAEEVRENEPEMVVRLVNGPMTLGTGAGIP